VDVANSLVGSTTQSSECIYAGCIARDAALSVEQFKKFYLYLRGRAAQAQS